MGSSITARSGARWYGQSLQSNFIKEWRKARALKQDALARLLGVDRSLISKLENGVEAITARHQQKIWDLVNASIGDPEKIEAARIRAFQTPKGLFEFDGVRLLSASSGLLKIWPGAESLHGFAFEDHMINEARAVLDCRTTVDGVRSGDIVMISGASLRQSQVPNDDSPSILHHWHYVFRRIGGRLFVESTMEAATEDTQVGIHKMLRLSDIGM